MNMLSWKAEALLIISISLVLFRIQNQQNGRMQWLWHFLWGQKLEEYFFLNSNYWEVGPNHFQSYPLQNVASIFKVLVIVPSYHAYICYTIFHVLFKSILDQFLPIFSKGRPTKEFAHPLARVPQSAAYWVCLF